MARTFTALCTLLLLAAPAAAQTSGGYYRAVLDKPAAPLTVISSDVVWHGHDNVLEAPAAGDIARRVCAVLAQNVGKITEFSAQGKKLADDDLTVCNKHAKKS